MTNTKLLGEVIEDRGLKLGYIAEQLGLSSQGFRKKIKNESEFKVSEVASLKEILSLTEAEVQQIFFDSNVA